MSARWAIVVVSKGTVASVDIPSARSLIVGRGPAVGLELDDPTVDERHLSLRVVNERAVLDPLGGTSGVRVNDVACGATLPLSPGDEIALGDTRLVVVRHALPLEPSVRLSSEDELDARLDEEVRRAGERRCVGFVLVSTAGLNVAARQALTRRVVDAVAQSGAIASWGAVADDLLGAVVPELAQGPLDELLALIPSVAGPRAVTASACAPRDGSSGVALVEAAFTRLLSLAPSDESPSFADPAMLRLSAVLEGLDERAGPVALIGPPGAGRATLARSFFVGRGVTPTVLGPRELSGAALPSAVLVRDADALSDDTLAAVLEHAKQRRRSVVLTAVNAARLSHLNVVIDVPALAARPRDIEALAEQFQRDARAALGRPRLALGDDARRLLLAWPWPGNVRELKAVVFRAARAAVRDEIGSDALPARFSATGPRATLRGAMHETERGLLLEALARTRWNVTAAAARLGLPRRTVVYRMARLGLKRPARHR